MNLPSYFDITKEQVDYVCENIIRIQKIIIETLNEINEELENPTSETKLYGALDSLALVSLITDLEERYYFS